MTPGPLDGFSDPTRVWFDTTFAEPTAAQRGAWPAIASGEHLLLCAPTGSGKTLAAFLSAIDRLSHEPSGGTRVLYVSPLRALAVDVDKNLRAPIKGIALAAERLGGSAIREPSIGLRTGDTSPQDRRRLLAHPTDLLITTPESLYLMLTSAMRETLRAVDTVIIDEIHAVAGTKRGSHLAVSLERLERICERPPQRIGLSATQRPLAELAHFLGGNIVDERTAEVTTQRPVRIIDAGITKSLEIEVVVPVDDMGAIGDTRPESDPTALEPGHPTGNSIWPSIHPRLLELIQQHRTTIIFVNARRLAERLATRLNELALDGENRGGESVGRSPARSPNEATPDERRELVRAHHGSLSRLQRLAIEDDLKSGRLKALVATSSLELGIDMGAVDLVIQVESPGSVARGLQRIGRAGHQVGSPSRGRFFPKHRSDLVETAVVVRAMQRGEIESTRFVRNPLDVLAQHVVAASALDEWDVSDLLARVRAAAPYTELSREVFNSVLDLLDGRYPSEEFAELRPRIVWDRTEDRLRGRPGAQRLAVTNAGTIPDRGLFGVFLPDGARVGELDEEMVYESRVGETFLLGATTWRIEEITFERVVVTPAPGLPAKLPFWHGDGPGRPIELGRAVGGFIRHVRQSPPEQIRRELRDEHCLDERAAQNLLAFLDEQAEATGVVPDDRTIVIERFLDEIGDWRICVLTPFGARVHAPWGMAIRRRLEQGGASDVEIMWSDDGIIFRLPEADDQLDLDQICIDPDEIRELVVSALPDSAMFASRFREASARALLLPRRRVDRRTPLWQQRQRAASLLGVASKYPTFPMLLETTRECINDVFDLPALIEVMAAIRDRSIRVVQVDTASASPFASSLLFHWIALFMYEGDAPLAERRAAALSLDRNLLRDLLGTEEMRSLLDADVLETVEAELQRTTAGRRARHDDELHDLLRMLGPLSIEELAVRREPSVGDLDDAIGRLVDARRAIAVVIAGEARIADAADAARLRDALGVSLPQGLPAVFTDPVDTPLRDLAERFARTHGPFTTGDLQRRLGISAETAQLVLGELAGGDRVVSGEFRPAGRGGEWCDSDVLRQLRRRTLAHLRSEVEPVEADVLGRFLPAWQGHGSSRSGSGALREVIAQLQGAPLVASMLDADLFAPRLGDYRASDLDALCTSGEVVWIGAGAIGSTDGRLRLMFRDQAALLATALDDARRFDEPHHLALREHLERSGASFWTELVGAVADAGLAYDEDSVHAALWDLVWVGEITNDSLAPVRARVASNGRSATRAAARSHGRRAARPMRGGPPTAAGRWSSTRSLLRPEPNAAEASVARAEQLLSRYGVVTREMALAEGTQAGFAGVYPVLKAMEEQGRIRRGYFIAGLGAAQFASHGALDRLRAARKTHTSPLVLAATDPAQPYGAVLAWPEPGARPADASRRATRPTRSTGARVVLVDGRAVAWLDRGGRSLVTFPCGSNDADDLAADAAACASALVSIVASGRVRRLEIARVDGQAAGASSLADVLRTVGFIDGYRGLVMREPRAATQKLESL